MHHRTKFGEDRSNRSGDMADFRFLKIKAEFQKLKISTSGPVPRPSMRHCAKFREDRSNRFGDMADF